MGKRILKTDRLCATCKHRLSNGICLKQYRWHRFGWGFIKVYLEADVLDFSCKHHQLRKPVFKSHERRRG